MSNNFISCEIINKFFSIIKRNTTEKTKLLNKKCSKNKKNNKKNIK